MVYLNLLDPKYGSLGDTLTDESWGKRKEDLEKEGVVRVSNKLSRNLKYWLVMEKGFVKLDSELVNIIFVCIKVYVEGKGVNILLLL